MNEPIKSEEEWNEIFKDKHKKGETCRITISFFMQHYGLKPVLDYFAEQIFKSLQKNGLESVKDFMIIKSSIYTKDSMEDIPKAKPKDVRGMKLKW